jgi:transposase
MAKRYRISLTNEERTYLEQLTRSGSRAARKIRRARTLLLAADGCTDDSISAALGVSVPTIQRTRRRCVEAGVEVALIEQNRPGAVPKLNPKAQTTVIALACTTPPEGRARWTMQLLADRVVELRLAPDISRESIRRLLKKTGSSPG